MNHRFSSVLIGRSRTATGRTIITSRTRYCPFGPPRGYTARSAPVRCAADTTAAPACSADSCGTRTHAEGPGNTARTTGTAPA
ncbi:hypothetical protein F750_0597 [Streptomyces sp. PAMC 26508]|nr:hypothetical protein F750_0597 [Streptomyces sp. PAMC 26508]